MSKVIRVIVGGEGRIGFLRLLKLSNKISMTMGPRNGEGFDLYSNLIEINDTPYRLSLWEFTEKEKWKFLLEPFIKDANGAILVFELIRTSLLEYIKNWVKLLRRYNRKLPIVLVGTIPNLRNMCKVDQLKIRTLLQELKLLDFVVVIPKTGENLELVFKSLLRGIFRQMATAENEKYSEIDITDKSLKKYLNKNHTEYEISQTNISSSEYIINPYLKLVFEQNRTNIYINNKKFIQCKYLLLVDPHKSERQEEIQSIDEAQVYLNGVLEGRMDLATYGVSAKEEFWGHSSNLQAWYDHGYDTRLLHRNLAFPLLRALTEAGDPTAAKVFKTEIAERISCGFLPVILYLIEQNYLNYLTNEELECIIEDIKSKFIRSDAQSCWGILGLLYMGKNQYEKANAAFKRVTSVKTKNSEFWKQFGDSFCYKGEVFRATDCYEKAIKLAPDKAKILVDVGYTFLISRRGQDYDKAIKYCTKALELDPKETRAWYIKGEALKGKKQFKEAIEAFENTIKYDPKVAYVWHSMGDVHKHLKNYVKAMECYERAVEITENPDYRMDSIKELITSRDLEIRKRPWLL